MRRLRHLLAITLLVAVPATAGELDGAVATLAGAFRESSADDLRPLLADEGHIWLAVPAVDPEPGFRGSDQVYYLLDGFFSQHPTHRFAIATLTREHGDVDASADWSYQVASGTHDERLRVILVERDGRWLLSEIRAAGP